MEQTLSKIKKRLEKSKNEKKTLQLAEKRKELRQLKYKADKISKSNEHQMHCQNHLGNNQWLSKSFCFKPTWQNT